MSHRYPLIYNPTSGGGLSHSTKQFLMHNAQHFTLLASRSEEDALRLLDKYLAEGEAPVIISGGDGTLNKVLPRFLDAGAPLAILPTGTMNVFAREMGLSTMDFNQVLEAIMADHRVKTDIFKLNGAPFIQMAGIGYDAHIIEETSEEQKKRLGPLAYASSIAKVLGNNSPPKVKVRTAEGVEVEGVCALIGNGKLYGGHLTLFSKADNTDGLIDAIVIKSNGYQAVLDLSLNLIHEEIPALNLNTLTDQVIYLQSTSLEVRSEVEVPYELDGEYYGRSKEFKVEKGLRSLEVIAPQEKPKNEWSERMSALRSLTPLR